jgi:poly(A) polymerase
MMDNGASIIIPTGALALLRRVSALLDESGTGAYLVGGLLRDIILGRPFADIDIAVDDDGIATAQKIASALGGSFVLLDRENGIGRVVLSGDGTTKPWELDFSRLQGGIEPDLSRRDFTINALAIDLAGLIANAGNIDVAGIIDPFHGRDDLEKKIIRAVSQDCFRDDPARLLRAVRLAAELGFVIDAGTEALAIKDHELVITVAGERVREELLKLLAVPDTGGWLRHLDRSGLLTAIIPELTATKGVIQPKEHYWDVFEHTLETVSAVDFVLRQGNWRYAGQEARDSVPWSPVLAAHFRLEVSHGSTRQSMLKVAALLHDVAKPSAKAVGEDGRTHFIGHARLGAEIAIGILGRLRFSSREIKLVEVMVKEHLRPTQLSNEGMPSHRAVYRFFRDAGEAGTDILFLNLADHLATRGPELDLAGWQEHTRLTEYILAAHQAQEKLAAPVKLLNGNDLILSFGLSPGPKIGTILELVKEAQASGEISTREEALALARDRLRTEVVSRNG